MSHHNIFAVEESSVMKDCRKSDEHLQCNVGSLGPRYTRSQVIPIIGCITQRISNESSVDKMDIGMIALPHNFLDDVIVCVNYGGRTPIDGRALTNVIPDGGLVNRPEI